jgi:hypothetical protein
MLHARMQVRPLEQYGVSKSLAIQHAAEVGAAELTTSAPALGSPVPH